MRTVVHASSVCILSFSLVEDLVIVIACALLDTLLERIGDVTDLHNVR